MKPSPQANFWSVRCKHCGTWHEPFANGRRVVAVQCCGETHVLHVINHHTQRTMVGYVNDCATKSDYAVSWNEHRQSVIRGGRQTALDFQPRAMLPSPLRQSKRSLRVRKCNPPRLTSKVPNN